MNRFAILVAMLFAVIIGQSAYGETSYVGHWALTIPGGGPGWLGVEEKDGQLQASILWGGGSVKPAASAMADRDRLVITRIQVQRNGPDKGKKITETISATRSGNKLNLVTVKSKPGCKQFGQAEFTGKLTTLPPRPDLSNVKFDKSIELLNGQNLTGWKPLNPKAVMGWSVKDGVLSNRTQHESGKRQPHTNIRTEREFEDFRLTLETRTLKDSNSGIYLRGVYEILVFESNGRPLNPHNMGAVYSRITPTIAAEKPIGEWQTMDITLVDKHVTVILNGKKIIDNHPVLGCTGGALWSDPDLPAGQSFGYRLSQHGASASREVNARF